MNRHEAFKEKSIENLEIAKICLENKMYNGCVNRAYYSMFHIAIAILLKDNHQLNFSQNLSKKERPSHKEIMGSFTSYYCNKNKIFPELREYLYNVQQKRDIADYTYTQINKKVAKRAISKAMEFCEKVQARLENA